MLGRGWGVGHRQPTELASLEAHRSVLRGAGSIMKVGVDLQNIRAAKPPSVRGPSRIAPLLGSSLRRKEESIIEDNIK